MIVRYQDVEEHLKRLRDKRDAAALTEDERAELTRLELARREGKSILLGSIT